MVIEDQVIDLMTEIYYKYGEHIEMTEDRQEFVIQTLAILLIKEREKNDYYRKLHATA